MYKGIVTMLLLVGLLPTVQAETAAEKGLAIITESDNRDKGWVDSSADLLMTLRNKKGGESIREMRIKSLEVEGDGDKSLTVFDQPRDVKGTAFLTYSHALDADEQWIFLPALKRVKRISSSNKSGPFMGSEFAYEDISSFEIEKYSYVYLSDEVIDGMDCFVVETKPLYKYSGYTKSILWIDKAEYQLRKVDYFDRKNSLLKTQQFSDYQKFLDQYWRPLTMTMENKQNGKSTELKFSNYKFRTGLTDKDFEKNDLKRQR